MALTITYPEHYQQQLTEKAELLTQMLSPFNQAALEVFPSPPEYYRMRAEFRVWHDGDDLYYIMFDSSTQQRIRVDQFPIASELINQLMPALLDYIRERPTLRYRLFQVDFLSTTTNQAVVSLLYHRSLEEDWQQEAELLQEHLSQFGTIYIVGRARKQKLAVTQDWVIETLNIQGTPYHFQQIENSFTQPNAAVNQQMIQWALAATQNATGDLLELYCGNGNFSLPLAQNFDRVLATEISKPSVASAQFNCQLNSIDNVTLVRMSAEDFSAVMQGEKQSRRLPPEVYQSFHCQTVLVDPPRAGLDEATLELVSRYPTIMYISCNPTTLVENLSELTKTHDVVKAALFDQFPYTAHMETGVLLQRKQ